MHIRKKKLLIIKEVQASGVIIDRLLRQCCFELSSMNDTNQRGHGVQLKWYVTLGHWTKMLIFQAVIEDQHVHYELGCRSNDHLIWPGGKTDSEDTEWESSRVVSFCF